MKDSSMRGIIGVGLIGAGYIARWHLNALRRIRGVRVVGVYDAHNPYAEAFASSNSLTSYSTLDALLAASDVSSVHILTPPHTHAAVARHVIEAGKHAFIEKPMTVNAAEARALHVSAAARGVMLGVNHNFLMQSGYDRLKADLRSGAIGPIDSLAVNWRHPLEAMRAGPYSAWMLRKPENVLFEIGAHVFAFLADLVPHADVLAASTRHPIETPAGLILYQGWRIEAQARNFNGTTAASLDLSLIEGHDDRSVEVRGLGGKAQFDFAEDAYVLEKATPQGIVLAPLNRQLALAGQALRTGAVNAVRQISSLNAFTPYGHGIFRACESFYKSVLENSAVDARLSPALAARALDGIEAAIARTQARRPAPSGTSVTGMQVKDAKTMLVIGGTGFIGRALVKALLDAGYRPRIFSRSASADVVDRRIEHVSGELTRERDLLAAMQGVAGVFHLARANEKTWAGYLANDVAVTKLIGECCLRANAPRLVYAGTIDSYDASRADRPISEETPLDPNILRRNLYARSKAACEAALLDLAGHGLNLVIVRPGIVVGRGGPLKHWGIAMWHGASDCSLWGGGENILPFVGVDDCAEGFLKAMTTPGVDGRSFNLVGEPMLTARQYFDELSRAHGIAFRARPTPLWRYYLVDLVKYGAKRWLARKSDLEKPSLHDWRSRGQFSPFRNDAAKRVLGWRPQTDRGEFIRYAIEDSNLFGTQPLDRLSLRIPEGVDEHVVDS